MRVDRLAPEKAVSDPSCHCALLSGFTEKQMSKTYSEKLLDPRWQRKRLEILSRSDFQCEACMDSENTLHVHHKHYIKGREPWEYEPHELVVLCKECHSNEHDARMMLDRALAAVPSKFMEWDCLVSMVAGFLINQSPPGHSDEYTLEAIGTSWGDKEAYQAGLDALEAFREARLERMLAEARLEIMAEEAAL